MSTIFYHYIKNPKYLIDLKKKFDNLINTVIRKEDP